MVELTNSLISPLICALLCNKTKRKPYPILIACKFNIDNFTSYTNTLSHARIKMNSEGLIGSSVKFVNFRIKRNFVRLIDSAIQYSYVPIQRNSTGLIGSAI